MRHTYRQECLISDKAHLWRLPNMNSSEIPLRLQRPSKRGLVLIPLFEARPYFDDVERYCVISACWARRSWIVNSDAYDFGVEVKFYVERKVKDQVEQVFGANGILESDIIWFDGDSLEGALPVQGGYATFGAKEGAIYSDTRFADYEWVFIVDSDLFVVTTCERHKPEWRLKFFQTFFEICKEPIIGALWIGDKPDNPPYRVATENNWCRDGDGNTTPKSLDHWKDRIGKFVGEDILNIYLSPDHWYAEPQGGLTAYPSKHFQRHRRRDVDFLTQASYLSASSELPLSLWHAEGNPLFSVQRDQGIPVLMCDRSFSTETTRMLDIFSRNTIPFLLHYASTSIEQFWREGIGAL